jgi:hypothetical protein
MIGQRDLFYNRDICANRHKGAETSVEAHKTIQRSKSERREAVYKAIERRPGAGITVDELAELWQETPNAISGRFSELAQRGRIVKDGVRKTRSGCNAAVWRIKQ